MNNSWHNGVVDMSFATQSSNHLDCLLSKDEMQAWCNPKSQNYDDTKCDLLNKITCNSGSGHGLDCHNNVGGLTFGPPPTSTGESIPNTILKGNNCFFKDAANPTKPINIGPPDSAGKCTRNIFYCNGHGTCKYDKLKEMNTCICDDDYTIENSTGTNVCIKPTPGKKYKCMQTYDAKNNSLVMGCQETSDSSGKSLVECVSNCNENLYRNKDLACRPGDEGDAKNYQYCGDCAYLLQNNKCSDKQYGSRQPWEKADLATITVRHPGAADRNVSVIGDFAPFIYRPPYPCVGGNIFCLPKGLSKNGGQVEYPI